MNTIAKVDIKALAEQYGTPVYVYDKGMIIQNYSTLKNAFAKYYNKTKIHFSVKANSNIKLLQIFKEIGSGADCSSPFELILAEKAGFTQENLLYTGNYESYFDLEQALLSNVTINLDDINSFKRLIKIRLPDRISFRINPGIGRGGFEGIVTGGTDAKFGIPYEKAYDAYKLAKESGVKRFGIHMMTGSNNLEPYYFAEIVDKLMTIAGDIFTKLEIIPEFVDIGGGFGVPYNDNEEPLNVDLTARLVTEMFTEKCNKYAFGEPFLFLEPGRYLIANSGFLISKVTGIKNSYKKFVGIDSGMNTLLRPALYGARHRIEVYDKNENQQLVNICGQICENSDIFSLMQPFPDVEEDDIVVIRDVGAYGYVMASNYNNRLRPPEVLVDGEKHELIRRRENIDDVLRLYEFSTKSTL
jgi:diaminopimelate decarboxylase